MRVIEEMDALMSDYETLQFLISLQKQHRWTKESREKDKKHKPYYHPELQTITRDTVRYLTQRSAVPDSAQPEEITEESPDSKSQPQSALLQLSNEQFVQLMKQLNDFPLFKAEKLQIVNQLPTNLVHLYSIVEECESRLDEGQVTSLLECVQRTCQN